jgi:uncharacterized membrane protein
MAFTTFIDNLALVEVLLLLGATIFAYGGVLTWWAIRNNDPKGARAALRGMSVPLGGIGLATTVVALWGEMTWPFLASDGLAGYNIFFFDTLLLFGLVLLAFAVSAYLQLRLQYVGLFALIAGGVTAFYGYTGYTASPAFTKDPFDTLLLYAAFAAAGVFAFPATVVIDYFLATSDAQRVPFGWARRTADRRSHSLGVRGVQPVAPGAAAAPAESEPAAASEYRVPLWVHTLLLLFPVFMGLAAIAAFWYFGTTLPGHLGGGAGAAP